MCYIVGISSAGTYIPFYVISHFFHSFRIKRGDLIIGNTSNNEEIGPSDQDADEMDYEGEQQYLDFLSAKQRQGLQAGLDDGTDADIDTDGAGTETGGEGTGGEDTGGEGTGPDAATEKRKHKKQRIRKPNKLGIGQLVITKMALDKFEPLEPEEPRKCYGNNVGCISNRYLVS